MKTTYMDMETMTDMECPYGNSCPTVCGPDQMSCDTTDANGTLKCYWKSKISQLLDMYKFATSFQVAR